LAFRWDGRQARFFFQTQPGSYTDRTVIAFLRDRQRHFWRHPVILIWDGLPAHKSGRMSRYLAQQRAWLRVERLPGYAPELNPVELVWGNSSAGNWRMCVRQPSTRSARRSVAAAPASVAIVTWRSIFSATPGWTSGMVVSRFREIH
jgi:DDE superfamily endonuclease